MGWGKSVQTRYFGTGNLVHFNLIKCRMVSDLKKTLAGNKKMPGDDEMRSTIILVSIQKYYLIWVKVIKRNITCYIGLEWEYIFHAGSERGGELFCYKNIWHIISVRGDLDRHKSSAPLLGEFYLNLGTMGCSSAPIK